MTTDKGFDSPNYTQTPNDLFDKHLREMGKAELKVVLAIVRYTFGYHRETCKLSIRKLSQITGMTENSVLAGAKKAEERGLITQIAEPRKVSHWIANVLSTSGSEADLPQVVRQTASGSEARINKDKEEITPAGKSKYIQEMEYLEEVFSNSRSVPLPDWSKDGRGLNKTWRQPLNRILKRCDGDLQLASYFVKMAVSQMKRQRLTFDMPIQIEKTANSLIADHQDRISSPEGRNYTAERLAQN